MRISTFKGDHAAYRSWGRTAGFKIINFKQTFSNFGKNFRSTLKNIVIRIDQNSRLSTNCMAMEVQNQGSLRRLM